MGTSGYLYRSLTAAILDAAIEVHRALGPGLLESAYVACLAHEMETRNLDFEREVPMALKYKALELPFAFRADFVVERKVILEIKAVESLQQVHVAQVLTYLRLSGLRLGLLINFNSYTLKNGVRRLIR